MRVTDLVVAGAAAHKAGGLGVEGVVVADKSEATLADRVGVVGLPEVGGDVARVFLLQRGSVHQLVVLPSQVLQRPSLSHRDRSQSARCEQQALLN